MNLDGDMLRTPTEIDNFIAELRATGIEGRAKREGDTAPDAALPDAHGRMLRLSHLWKQGPLVVVFYRGGWCSYCNLELHAWQQRSEKLREAGGQLVAISLEGTGDSLSMADRNGITYPVLHDADMDAIHGFDIAVSLPAELVDLYGASGATQPVLGAGGHWVLPVPATFVVDSLGKIRFADVDVDYRRRADPERVLEAVRSLRS